MAISSYRSAADAGVLCVILANTAVSISFFKEFVRCFLQVIGIHISPWEGLSTDFSDSSMHHRETPSLAYMEEFRKLTPCMQYGSIFVPKCPKQDCSICLTEFEQNAEIYRLSCSHVFHKSCLEKWLTYWNTTCPLCRNYMMPQDAEEDACPM